MYEESAAIPMVVAPAPVLNESPAATCDTPVGLTDLSETIIDHFDAELPGERPGKSLHHWV